MLWGFEMDLNEEQTSAVTHPEGEPAVIIAGAGSGKCLTKGTPVLKFSGEIIPVEDVIEGDLLMGPDSRPRRVLALGRGQDQLYRVQSARGDDWGCNAAHIQVLSHKGVEHELSVTDFLEKPDWFTREARRLRTGV